jgi:hypothetical protein
MPYFFPLRIDDYVSLDKWHENMRMSAVYDLPDNDIVVIGLQNLKMSNNTCVQTGPSQNILTQNNEPIHFISLQQTLEILNFNPILHSFKLRSQFQTRRPGMFLLLAEEMTLMLLCLKMNPTLP